MTPSRSLWSKYIVAFVLAISVAIPAFGDELTCEPGEALDVVSYEWKLKGILSFIAGLKFPTRGSGTLATRYRGNGTAETELRIISNDGDGDRYGYRSVIDLTKNRTVESFDGYHFDGRTKSDTTTFDYEKGKARRVRQDTKKGDDKTVRFDEFTGDNLKDVLTSIHHIRESSDTMKLPERHGVFANGKVYQVLITPGPKKKFAFQGKKVEAKLFTITATPENKDKWPGDIRVWITTDEDHLPVEIDLGKSMASLHLEAISRFNCP